MRRIVAPVVYHTGLHRTMTSAHRAKDLILCYHGVGMHSGLPYNGRHLEANVFVRHLKYFRDHFDIVSLAEIITSRRIPEKGERSRLAITFDDGYRNNLTVALPILESYKIPATVFATTACLDRRDAMIWTDVVDIARIVAGRESMTIAGYEFRRSRGSNEHRGPDGNSIYEYLMSLDPAGLSSAIDDLERTFSVRDVIAKNALHFPELMSRYELRKLAASKLVDIGAHSVRHLSLTHQSPEVVQYELATSKTDLEECLDREIALFAFPFGNHDQTVQKLGLEAGYHTLLALDHRLEREVRSPRIISRLPVSGTTNYCSQIIGIYRGWDTYGL